VRRGRKLAPTLPLIGFGLVSLSLGTSRRDAGLLAFGAGCIAIVIGLARLAFPSILCIDRHS
jgi:hypothetical protein